jgi:hypothetical protein
MTSCTGFGRGGTKPTDLIWLVPSLLQLWWMQKPYLILAIKLVKETDIVEDGVIV